TGRRFRPARSVLTFPRRPRPLVLLALCQLHRLPVDGSDSALASRADPPGGAARRTNSLARTGTHAADHPGGAAGGRTGRLRRHRHGAAGTPARVGTDEIAGLQPRPGGGGVTVRSPAAGPAGAGG